MLSIGPLRFRRRLRSGELALRQLGDRARDERRWADAAVWYRSYLEQHPRDFAIWVQMGNCLKDKGAHPEALAAYWRAIALNTRDADVFLQLGHLYKLMGRGREAIGAYRASMARDRTDNPAALELRSLGIVPDKVGAGQRARKRGSGLVGGPGRAQPAVESEARTEGDRLRDEGSWSAAAEMYRKHLEAHPLDFAIWVQAGNCLKEATAHPAALDAYWQAVALNSADGDIFLQLGHLLKLMGREAEAIAAYRVSIALQPDANPAALELSSLGASLDPHPVRAGADDRAVLNTLVAIEEQLQALIATDFSPPTAGTAAAQVAATASVDIPAPAVEAPPAPPAPPPDVVQLSASVQPVLDAVATPVTSPCIFLVVAPLIGAWVQPTRLGQELVGLGHAVRPVKWDIDNKRFVLVPREEIAGIPWPTDDLPFQSEAQRIVEKSSCGPNDWLVVPDTVEFSPEQSGLVEMEMLLASRRLGMRSAFVFKGAEPLRLPKYQGAVASAYEQYMQVLLLADLVVPVSTVAATDLRSYFVRHQQADHGPVLRTIAPPSDPGGSWKDFARRLRGLLRAESDPARAISSLYVIVDSGAPDAQARGSIARSLSRALNDQGVALLPTKWNAQAGKLEPAGPGDVQSGSCLGEAGMMPWVEPGEAGAPRWLIHMTASSPNVLSQVAVYARGKDLRTAALLDDSSLGAADADDRQSRTALYAALMTLDKVLASSEEIYADFYRFLLSSRRKVHSAEDRFKIVMIPDEVLGVNQATKPKGMTARKIEVLLWLGGESSLNVQAAVDSAVEAASRVDKQVRLTVVDASVAPDGDAPGKTQVRWLLQSEGDAVEKALEQADVVIVPGTGWRSRRLVAECVWRGLPCLIGLDNDGPSRTGALTCDFRYNHTLSAAIRKLLDPEWRFALSCEAIDRPTRTWSDYVGRLIAELANDRPVDGAHAFPRELTRDVYAALPNLQKRPRLSLCISTYNRSGWLALNLRNVFSQIGSPRADLEILVVDNASTDDTPEVVRPYLGRADFRYVRNPRNVGMLGNLAVTAQKATGEYIWILGDDDLTRPGAIQRVLEVITTHSGIELIYVNYGYTTLPSAADVADLPRFLEAYNVLEPAGPDTLAPVKDIAAKCENFFTAIYSHVYRRDHALRSYCQDTSGRIFSTMLSCVPTAYYVFNYMSEASAYWIGEPMLVVNSNVSWQDYGVLLDLEQLPRTWDLAERMGANPAEVDQRRANRLWLVEMMWKQIFENDRAGNSGYFSASRVLMRLKHLPEIDKHIPAFVAAYQQAREARHPGAAVPTEILFSAFPWAIGGATPDARSAAEAGG